MDSIGSAFFIVLLLTGVVVVFKKKALGITLISIALIFLYVIPNS